MRWSDRLSLFWRVCLINGGVFVVAAVVLVVSPATVSKKVTSGELGILACGLALIMTTNALLVRSTLAPLDGLVRSIDQLDTGRPQERLTAPRNQVAATLARSFNALLDRWELERSTSGARVIAAQERERRRIARELHDEVGQRLTVVLLGLKRAQLAHPSEVADELALVRDSARSSLAEVKRIASGLRPGVLDDLGLAAALQSMVVEFRRDTGVAVELSLPTTLPELTSEIELVVFRVAQEALTNVARHSSASATTVSLHIDGDDVVLEVTDDGHGFTALSPGGGVAGMTERALSTGGSVSVTSAAAGGVDVQLRVPTTRVLS